MATSFVGQRAELEVADHLTQLGYKVLARNWKTELCEIDIVAAKDNIVHFVEVKYRRSSSQGSGFDYIVPQKLRQIEFAARVWCQMNGWDGDYRLMAVSVDGSAQKNIDLVEII